MPAKYSHVKKRNVSGLKKVNGHNHTQTTKDARNYRPPNPNIDRSITQAMTSVSQLERAIARILLIRFEHDIARLFSTRLYSIALVHLPTFVMRCISVSGPSWTAFNADCEEIKDFFRAAISMDMRQAGERVATKSVLWSYTALRHFAMSNNVSICPQRGLHSLRLLPYYPALKAHLDVLESLPYPTFTKPPHLGTLIDGHAALEDACQLRYDRSSDSSSISLGWDRDWKEKVRVGYEKVAQTLWRVAREFDVRGYGLVLREKLTTKWCDCGCSTDHLGEVCEKTVREDEEESGVRHGKQREWDGRGGGVYGWETEEEEDMWEVDLDFGADECEAGTDCDMTIAETMEWRYLKAEREKEQGNTAFRKGHYEAAIKYYQSAHETEPELPHYQLNLAAAHLKLCNWMEAEKACTKALGQHLSGKGYFRRAKARKMMGRVDEAIRDLRAVLKVQPTNGEALAELTSLLLPPEPISTISSTFQPDSPSSSSSARRPQQVIPTPSFNNNSDDGISRPEGLLLPKPKLPKPLPFARTKADDRKLKISLIPMTVDMPVLDPCSGSTALSSPQRPMWRCGGDEGVEGMSGGGICHPSIDGGAGTTKMKAETIAYPSWDKYVVRRVG